jgi:hypothetical protein
LARAARPPDLLRPSCLVNTARYKHGLGRIGARPNGKPPGPPAGLVYHPAAGPGALRSAPLQLVRLQNPAEGAFTCRMETKRFVRVSERP